MIRRALSDEIDLADPEAQGLEDSVQSNSFDVADTSWGAVALELAQELLSTPAFTDLELYSFRANPSTSTIEIRLDKLSGRRKLLPAAKCATRRC